MHPGSSIDYGFTPPPYTEGGSPRSLPLGGLRAPPTPRLRGVQHASGACCSARKIDRRPFRHLQIHTQRCPGIKVGWFSRTRRWVSDLRVYTSFVFVSFLSGLGWHISFKTPHLNTASFYHLQSGPAFLRFLPSPFLFFFLFIVLQLFFLQVWFLPNRLWPLFFVFHLKYIFCQGIHFFVEVEVQLPPNLPPTRAVEVRETHTHTHQFLCGLRPATHNTLYSPLKSERSLPRWRGVDAGWLNKALARNARRR